MESPLRQLTVTATLAVALTLAGTCARAQAPAGWPQLVPELRVTGLDLPVHATHAGDGSGRLFVVEQRGRIRLVTNGTLQPAPFLDITARVGCCGERGLLSVAFPPGYAIKGYFYVNYTDRDGTTVVARYRVSADPDLADPGSEQVVLTVAQPFSNHNGGQLAFGPDGYLYVGMGDGGSGGDPQDNGQRANTLLGKLLRLDVEGGTQPYAIPPDNPFRSVAGWRGEIWAYGLRNPWRFSFDRSTGDLWIGDVGQNRFEEVDFQPAGSTGGQNYGWRLMEGAHCYDPDPCTTTGLTLPVAEYGRVDGCSVTGGHVYRGSRYPRMQGVYLYGDYCTGRIWGLRRVGQGFESALLLDTPFTITTFGEGEDGTVYVTDYSRGELHALTDPSAAASYTVTVPAVAHVTGAAATPWRSDLGLVNRSAGDVAATLAYRDGGTPVGRSVTVPAGAVREWRDVLVTLFELPVDAATAGAVTVTSDGPLLARGRTWAATGAGSFGQDYPGLGPADGIGPGTLGVLAPLRRDAGFYSNVGVVNLGTTDVTVAVRLLDVAGVQVGSMLLFDVPVGEWRQVFDAFAAAGAGDHAAAYGVIEVLTAGGRAWAYGAVIDRTTRDPSTVPLVVPPAS
jgi:glucose/arabinose dehydrogenase